MKPYINQNNIPFPSILLFVAGSIILGITIGALAYLISNFWYLFIVFPLAVGGLAMIPYLKLQRFTKVRHGFISTLMGVLTGLLIVITFYAVPYFTIRFQFITDAQKNYQVDAVTASRTFDEMLTQKTGSSGFIGFLKLRADIGDNHKLYFGINGAILQSPDFTIKSTGAWIYWLIESILFIIPIAWMGYDERKSLFNKSANDWYNQYAKQIGSVPLDRKKELYTLLQMNNWQEISELIISEEELSHPVLEIYEQHSLNGKGDILLTIKQTKRASLTKVSRKILSWWEVSQQEFSFFEAAVKLQLAHLQSQENDYAKGVEK